MAKYSGKDIQSFDHDVDKIRQKPTQYMGELGDPMVLTVVREPIDNVIDEHLAGRGDKLHVFYDPATREVTVLDEGNGIPTEPRKVHGKTTSTMTVVFTQLQAGGKFKEGAYDAARGTHGVGVTATNALSTRFKVWSTYKGKVVSQEFVKGHPKTPMPKSDTLPTFGFGKYRHKMAKKGTAIQFIPDQSVIGKKAELKIGELVKMLDTAAYMNPGMTITLTVNGKGQKVFRHKGGLGDYLKKSIADLKCGTLGKPCIINGKVFNLAFQFTDYDGDDSFMGHTNGLPQTVGGAHVDLFRARLYKVLLDFAGARAKPFTERDLRDGVVGLIDFKLNSPQFSSQTKEKLVDIRVKDHTAALDKELKKFFEANKSLAKDVITRAGELKALREDQLKDKRALRELKQTRGGSKLPPPNKLTTSTVKPEHRELFLVEGDSAGGHAKYARFPHQEVLKLRGKILNVARDDKGKVWDSDEAKNVLLAIGYDPNKKEPFKELRVGRVVLLADPDADGAHINSLLLALHHKYLRPMIDAGMVYVCHAKEYVSTYKGANYFGNSIAEVRKSLPKDAPKSLPIQHIKGYGEIDSDLLREVAFNPETRQLIKIKPLTSEDNKRFNALMKEDTEYRKKLLNIQV